ncbi:TetR/AcrR family transcriptional regulator [Salinirubellus salinus]|uniref:TetR/AcrR family transcriptional regulator n=1 Tax=Salinirubellus salinus TaxID=1364945 RepID=A0A9E7QZH2_9EURY|nr:TetR/AcrR family transcriptional regulator [Salinirubellus salinus]UWM52768.1 TetR/AcrR family transcriptional regulator [Salinirubellus salinus]
MSEAPWMEADRTVGQRELLEATFRVLRTHGHSGLSIGRIAAESGRSKATLYSHYDDRDELVRDALVVATGRLTRRLEALETDDPAAALDATVELLLGPASTVEPSIVAAREVVVELRAEAAVDDGLREVLTAFDDRLYDYLRECLRVGIEHGVFEPGDPAILAEHVAATLNGALVASVSTDREVASRVRAGLHAQLEPTRQGS